MRRWKRRFRHKQGGWVVLESMAHNALPDPAINGIVVNAHDVTGRQEAQDELLRLNWALHALGKGNTAMMHAVTENELFQACCDAIADAGGYPLAWLGLARDDESVEIVARAGAALPYLQGLSVSWADAPEGRGPTGTAIRSGQTQVNNNMQQNEAYFPWMEGASAQGFASSLALPIRANGAVLGVLAVYSRMVDAFQQPEIALFEELAADIGYGIRSRRTRTERDQLLQQQLLDEATFGQHSGGPAAAGVRRRLDWRHFCLQNKIMSDMIMPAPSWPSRCCLSAVLIERISQ